MNSRARKIVELALQIASTPEKDNTDGSLLNVLTTTDGTTEETDCMLSDFFDDEPVLLQMSEAVIHHEESLVTGMIQNGEQEGISSLAVVNEQACIADIQEDLDSIFNIDENEESEGEESEGEEEKNDNEGCEHDEENEYNQDKRHNIDEEIIEEESDPNRYISLLPVTNDAKNSEQEHRYSSGINDKQDCLSPESSDDSRKDPDYTLNKSDNEEESEEHENKNFGHGKENEYDRVENHGKSIGNEDDRIRKTKRKQNINSWARNIKKIKVNSGQAYKTQTGREKTAKGIRNPSCKENCSLQCFTKINRNAQKSIFANYYASADKQKQRQFVARHIDRLPKSSRRKENSKRQPSFAYYLEVDGQKIRTCKHFFKSTLALSNNAISTVMKKIDDHGFLEPERRGTHNNRKVTGAKLIEGVKRHINSFPRVESHYCRASSSKDYIEGSLNISIMYRLYTEYCKEFQEPFVKFHTYNKIFHSDFNIGFFKPKKDLCNFCEVYKNKSEDEKAEELNKYEQHKREINNSRQEKERDKNADSDTLVICYDLQAVCQLPNGNVSSFYYKSKLNVFNFTLFDLKLRQGYCKIWHEGIAKRGANEIGTGVFTFLKENCINKEVIFYSDNCSSQNKNKYLCSMYIYCVKFLKITSITHKYLIVGHTENEGDSMHSCIEREKNRILKSGPIFVPSEFTTIVKGAKKNGKPYLVQELETSDFIDWKAVSERIGKNFTVDTNGQKVLWSEIKILKIESENPNLILFKTSYTDENFGVIDVTHKMRGKRQLMLEDIELKPAYSTPPTLGINKKNDLISLCNEKLIHKKEHVLFYKNLL